MAHRLNDLTEEGQYILLSHLGKIDAIENFCDVYPQFRRTYYSRIESFKEISPNWLLQDSYTYLRESIWIANYRGVLNRWDTPTAEVKGAIDQYVAYELTGRRMPAGEWQKGDSCYDMPVDGIQDKLIANHRYILKLYRHLVGYELNRRDATENGGAVRRTLRTSASQQPSKANKVKVWPTVYEEQNFVRALYRLWVLVLMGCEHKRPLDRNLWLGCVMGIWNGDFWGSIHVMAVQKIIHEAIASAIDETIYKDKEKTIPRGDIDSAMFEPNFKIEIASASLLHDFPALVPNWFQAVGTPTNRQKREEHINDIREFLKRRVCVDRDVPSANLSIFDTHSEFYKSNLVEGRYINQGIGFQRVSKRGAGLEVMPYSGNLLWVQLDDIKNPAASSLDLSVVIWDNWRCKTWGFKNPSFNRTNVSLIPPGST